MKPYDKEERGVTPGTVRMVAEWVVSLGDQPGPDFDPDAVVYGKAFVDSMEEGIKLCEENDLDGDLRMHEEIYDRYCGWMYHRDLDPYAYAN